MASQNNLTLVSSMSHFSGINTVDDPLRFRTISVKTPDGFKAAYPLVEAVNVDIDNTYALTSRDGFVKKTSGTSIHSFWSEGILGFFVDTGKLYQLNLDYSVTELLNVNDARMSYVQVNDRVYMTNGSYIGYYNNFVMNSLRPPTEAFKIILPPGQRIAYHKGKIFIARGKVLYISDGVTDHYDVRTGFRIFENDITMVRPVDNGVYVSDGKTWYLSEKGEAMGYSKELAFILDAIPFSDAIIDGSFVGEGEEGKVGIWATIEGVCVGNNKGVAKIVTPNYLVTPGVEGAATIRNIDGVVHYLATIN